MSWLSWILPEEQCTIQTEGGEPSRIFCCVARVRAHQKTTRRKRKKGRGKAPHLHSTARTKQNQEHQ